MAVQRKAGLGRGLSALLDDIRTPDESAAQFLPIASITANPDQPRRRFDPQALAELSQSIAEKGVLQPILVRPLGGDRYEIVAGERRWRACQMAQMHEIPAMVRAMEAVEALQIGIIENVQRADLNPIEEAASYRRLVYDHGHTQEVIGRIVGKSRSHISNMLRLLELPDAVREAVEDGRLTMGHARALAGSKDPEALMRAVLVRGLSVRETEMRASRAAPIAAAARREDGERDADIVMLERQIANALGLKAAINANGTAGKVEIRYASLDQLDMIVAKLTGGHV